MTNDKLDIEIDTPEIVAARAARVAAATAAATAESAPMIELGDAPAVPSLVDSLAAIASQPSAVKSHATIIEPTERGNRSYNDPHPEMSTAPEAQANMAAARANAAAHRERERVAAEAAEIAARAEAEAKRQAEEQERADRAPILSAGQLVAGAAAEGHGVAFAWRGKGDMTRGQISGVLERAGLPTEWTMDPVGPEAQASRALATLKADGFTIRPEKRAKRQVVEAKEYDARWLVDAPNHGAAVGDKSGDVVLVATLIGNDIELDGNRDLAARVRKEYADRCDAELCKSSDITAWMQETMKNKLDAVRMGLGWYVPRANAETAKRLCNAFEKAGWGDEEAWTEIPVASGEMLRTGLLKGLAFEVKAVLHQLAQERETAKTKEDREDIGNKRAATFLGELKKVGKRVVAYGQLLGADKVESLRVMIHDAIVVLESSLSEDDKALVARFQNLWAEVERDRANAGGVLS